MNRVDASSVLNQKTKHHTMTPYLALLTRSWSYTVCIASTKINTMTRLNHCPFFNTFCILNDVLFTTREHNSTDCENSPLTW